MSTSDLYASGRGICRTCRAQVIWATTEAGKPMPVDAEPVDNGNVELAVTGPKNDRTIRAYVVNPDQPALGAQPERRLSHFVTCPDADQHRQRGSVRAVIALWAALIGLVIVAGSFAGDPIETVSLPVVMPTSSTTTTTVRSGSPCMVDGHEIRTDARSVESQGVDCDDQ